MTDAAIISGFVGFLIGMAVMAIGSYKAASDGWDEAWEEGYKFGRETEQIVQANERKEAELFGAEESGDG